MDLSRKGIAWVENKFEALCLELDDFFSQEVTFGDVESHSHTMGGSVGEFYSGLVQDTTPPPPPPPHLLDLLEWSRSDSPLEQANETAADKESTLCIDEDLIKRNCSGKNVVDRCLVESVKDMNVDPSFEQNVSVRSSALAPSSSVGFVESHHASPTIDALKVGSIDQHEAYVISVMESYQDGSEIEKELPELEGFMYTAETGRSDDSDDVGEVWGIGPVKHDKNCILVGNIVICSASCMAPMNRFSKGDFASAMSPVEKHEQERSAKEEEQNSIKYEDLDAGSNQQIGECFLPTTLTRTSDSENDDFCDFEWVIV